MNRKSISCRRVLVILFLQVLFSLRFQTVLTSLLAEEEKITIVGLARGTKMVQIDGGTRKGISKGMVLIVKRAGKNIAKIEITSASDFSARGNILEGENELDLEDEVFVDGALPTATSTSSSPSTNSPSTTAGATVTAETMKSVENKMSEISNDIKIMKVELADLKNQISKGVSLSLESSASMPSTATQTTPSSLPGGNPSQFPSPLPKSTAVETSSTMSTPTYTSASAPTFVAALGTNFFGETGLILVPTAETLNSSEIRLNIVKATVADAKLGNEFFDEISYEDVLTGYIVSYGASDNLEVGIGLTREAYKLELPDFDYSDSGTAGGQMFSLKYALPISMKSPALFAIGARYWKYKFNTTDDQGNNAQETQTITTLSAIVSKALDKRAKIKGHIQAGLEMFKASAPNSSFSENAAYYAAGLELTLMPRLNLSAEYMKLRNDDDPETRDSDIAFGARYAVTRQVNFTAAMVSFGLYSWIDKNYNYFFSLSSTFGGKKQ